MKTKTIAFSLVLTFACSGLFAATNTQTNLPSYAVTDSIPTDSIPGTDTLHKTDTVALKNSALNTHINSVLKANSATEFVRSENLFAMVPANENWISKK